MKTLTLIDKTTLSVADSSSEQDIIVLLKDKTEYETVKSQVTTDNLNGAALGDSTLTGLIVINSFLVEEGTDYVAAHFSLSKVNETEQRIADLEDLYTTMVGGAE